MYYIDVYDGPYPQLITSFINNNIHENHYKYIKNIYDDNNNDNNSEDDYVYSYSNIIVKKLIESKSTFVVSNGIQYAKIISNENKVELLIHKYMSGDEDELYVKHDITNYEYIRICGSLTENFVVLDDCYYAILLDHSIYDDGIVLEKNSQESIDNYSKLILYLHLFLFL